MGENNQSPWAQSRSPHGERGLKLDLSITLKAWYSSLPPRGAWIEISLPGMRRNEGQVAPPHGERGLKSQVETGRFAGESRRSPRGERGLKSSSAGILNLPKEDLLALLTETV